MSKKNKKEKPKIWYEKAILSIAKEVQKIKGIEAIVKDIDTKATHIINRIKDLYNSYRPGNNYGYGHKSYGKEENGYG